MKIVPQAFYQNPSIGKLMKDGDCCIIHKLAHTQDVDNHRLLSAHALTLVLSGGLVVHTDEGLPTRVSKGQMVLLPKGLYAITDLIPENASFEAVVYFFDDALVDVFLATHSRPHEGVMGEPRPGLFDVSAAFGIFTRQLLDLYRQVKVDAAVARMKLLEALHLIAQDDTQGEFLSSIYELKARPRKDLSPFMLNHFDKPLDVEDYARLSGRSVSTFRRDFHKQYGQSPRRWLIEKRLAKAEKILRAGASSIAAVAEQAGYSDLPHFIKSFQKKYQRSPKQYAIHQRNSDQ